MNTNSLSLKKVFRWFQWNSSCAESCFQIDGEKWAFGSTLDDLKKRRIDLHIHDDLRSALIISQGFQFGLQFAYIKVECFAPNRPLNKISYWILTQEPSGHSATVIAGHDRMQKVLGKSVVNSNSLIGRFTGFFVSGLVLKPGWTRWSKRNSSWEMNWFEKARIDKGNGISGVLTQTWHDEFIAAIPYAQAYRVRQRNYDGVTDISVLARITSAGLRRSFPLFLTLDKRGLGKVNRKLWEAQRALYNPDWYYTTDELIGKLNLNMNGELVVWQSYDGRFGVSTPDNTWISRPNEVLLVSRWLSPPENIKSSDPEHEVFIEGRDSVSLGSASASFDYEVGGNKEVVKFLSELSLFKNIKIIEHEICGS